MGKGFYPLISKAALLGLALSGCQSAAEDATMADILNGTISYPFVETQPLGLNGKTENFIIRSNAGGVEYVVEIPDAGKDYDIEIPLAALSPEALAGNSTAVRGVGSPAITDREIIADLPDATNSAADKVRLLDKAFGVGQEQGPTQAPSYTLGLAKISKLFQQKNYEFALIAINELLAFYPQSPRLHKMKGTIFIKIQNLNLALKSWQQALSLSPQDKVLRLALANLQAQMQREWEAPAEPVVAAGANTEAAEKLPAEPGNSQILLTPPQDR